MTLQVQTRLSTTTGKPVGRWRDFYTASDMRDAYWACTHLMPSVVVRIKEGQTLKIIARVCDLPPIKEKP